MGRFHYFRPSSVTVQVNPGRYFLDEKIYDLDGPLDLSMQVHLPLVIGNLRYVAILARGIDETVNENRMIETDVDTGETVQQSRSEDESSPGRVYGATGCAVAHAFEADHCVQRLLRGVCPLVRDRNELRRERLEDWRVKTLFEVEGRTRVLEGQMVIAFRRTTTLQTDLANVQARFSSIPRPQVIRQLQQDAARARRLLGLPEETRAYFYDPGLVKDYWDTNHADWLARIREGVRFSYAAERDDPNLQYFTQTIRISRWQKMCFCRPTLKS